MSELSGTPAPAARAELVWAIVWIVIGAAIFYGGWSMDRLEKLNINPYTAPGLVPALLGIGIALLGVVLLMRASRTPSAASAATHDSAVPTAASRWRLAIALALCLAYGAGLVGRGVPFWLATFAFVLVAIAAFQWPERVARKEIARGLAVAALCAAGTAIGVTMVFQELFLVRLP
jgi:hypothetical protein